MKKKPTNYKERFELFLESMNTERRRLDGILRENHKRKYYKECLETKELINAMDWMLEVATNIYHTGRDL